MKETTFESGSAHPHDEAVARLLRRVAWLMDQALTVPGTKVSVGLDALLGLLPLGGDVLTGCVQVGIVLVALRHYRVPREVAARMLANVLLDVSVGAIPLLGDLFDVAFKANTRNMRLLEPYMRQAGAGGAAWQDPSSVVIDVTPRKTPWRYILPIGIAVFAVLAFALIGFIAVVRWLWTR